MKILSIETSCDETAISVVEATGEFPTATYEILGNGLWSQIDVHREFGGVFPAVAKREHAATLVPMLKKALSEAELISTDDENAELDETLIISVQQALAREAGLADALIPFHRAHGKPPIDLIAVTNGPGLEPALWVGVSFAKALALLWNCNVVPINHMEGHIFASIYDVDKDDQLSSLSFPAISLLISGGHTELILMRDWGQYEKIGQTRDDAVGEAYDKVARLMGLPYPGGPEVAARAERARKDKLAEYASLPSPMMNSDDFDFSFSGLKTAVRYAIADTSLTPDETDALCRDFEDAAIAVLIKKCMKALDQYGAQSLIVGGGVSANRHLRRTLEYSLVTSHPDVSCYFPRPGLSTDNSIMIALVGHARAGSALSPAGAQAINAIGNRSLA